MSSQGFNCGNAVMSRRFMIVYLVVAVFFLITWIINTTNFIGLVAFLVFLVFSFVAVKPPRIQSAEERKWSNIFSVLMVLFFIVCLPLSVYMAVRQPVIGSTLILAFPLAISVLFLGLIIASYIKYGICR
ncbi:Na(+)/H(+) antiporter subunit E [Vulcanisaeta moutnovskia 768-28]|uniref:Na(+)/H(+) antiporter subunit E n=1 Tax=Vulcanisaeta moutnovskia (strain 768-28) TaxID=985053 RepID=F0QWR7_VULM7|nr:hypothetical protein [Vulcanisaeta moutnovskia]ADY02284.1 Na(+)/H(+) antiporter subunit E [Vulcanisaeta moutnovskia 768-28]